MILYKTLGINPGDLTRHFKVVVGHSQGTVPATLFASVSDEESFYALSEKALGILFLCGAIPDLECPDAEADLALIDESVSNEGPPSPMVSIRGIAKDQLSKFITEFNERSTGTVGAVYLSLVNTNNRLV
ncbi:beta subunit of fatty acid synthetase, partial [Linderina pennispora]